MVNWLRKIIFFIFKKIIPPYWIEKAINEEKVELAKQNCILGENTIILSDSRIINFQNNPNNIKIENNSLIRGELQINKYGGFISIGNYTYIGENSRIWSSDSIRIGNNVQISHGVNIIDNNTHSLNPTERHEEYKEIISKGNIQQRGNIQTAPIVIEDDVWISFNASVLKGVTIKKGAVVAANAVVTKDVESFTIVAGNPACFIKKIT